MIAVLDYGMGNVRSLYNALQWLGCDASVTADHGEVRKANRLVLPGVGAFGDAMRAIRERGLDELLDKEVRHGGKPLLGICLGMQLLANSSAEHGQHSGLGWIDATVERFSIPAGYKIPHVGWNAVSYQEGEAIFDGLPVGESNFYFVHSYHMVCRKPADVLATSEYGRPFTAAVRKGSVVAMQFHPEKSQDNGLTVLGNFLKWNP